MNAAALLGVKERRRLPAHEISRFCHHMRADNRERDALIGADRPAEPTL
jgi:hypothetical protein